MSQYNLERIKGIIGEINKAIEKLEGVKNLSIENFVSNSEKIDSAKYNLIVAIEGIIDISNHIIAKRKGRPPTDYADTFDVLKELGIISDEFGDKLKKMAKFRNLIVHLYWKVDDRRVYNLIKENLSDIKEILNILISEIKGQSD